MSRVDQKSGDKPSPQEEDDLKDRSALREEMRKKHWERFEMDGMLHNTLDPEMDGRSIKEIYQNYAMEWAMLTTVLLFCRLDDVRRLFETDYQRRPMISLKRLAKRAAERERRVGFPVPPLSFFISNK